MIRVLISFFVVLLFVGCTATNKSNVTYEEYKPQKSVNLLPTKVKEKKVSKKTPVSGSIKGNITKLIFKEGLWHYEIKSKNTSNKKLAIAKFTSTKKLAKKEDFVYAIIENGKLKEMFLIKKANYKRKIVKKTQKKKKKYKPKTYKRTKKYQVLGVPTVESISLD